MEANKKNTASSIMEMLSNGNSNDEVSDNKSLQIIEQENQKRDEPVLLFNQRSEEDKKKDELERFKQQVKDNILPIILSPIVGIIASIIYHNKLVCYRIRENELRGVLKSLKLRERWKYTELRDLNNEMAAWGTVFFIVLIGLAYGNNWLYNNVFKTHNYRNFNFKLWEYFLQLYGGIILIAIFPSSLGVVIAFYIGIVIFRIVGLYSKKY